MTKTDGGKRANEKRHKEALERAESLRPEIEKLYCEELLSQEEVGKRIGYSQAGVGKLLKVLGIVSRTRENLGQRNGRFVDGSQSRMYRKVIEKKTCARCGVSDRLVIHHKNGDHYDNAEPNLQVLCVSCHQSIHKTDYWAALRNGEEPPHGNGPVGWDRD